MTPTWDLIAYDRNNRVVLAVEVKRKLNASREWATQFRRNILAHGTFLDAPYFLMAFPDKFYLWDKINSIPGKVEPTYSIDARPILQPYFQRSGTAADRVSSESLELIVASWLNEVIHTSPAELDSSQQWLIDSGLMNAVAGGNLNHEVVA
jgi:hypothetical protein